jgi:hypothetical protein
MRLAASLSVSPLPGEADGLARLRSAASADCANDKTAMPAAFEPSGPSFTPATAVCVYLSVLTTRLISLSVLTTKFGDSGEKVVRTDMKTKKWSEVIRS